MGWEELITVTPGVRSGRPCVLGTRITVQDVLEYLAAGMTEAQILANQRAVRRTSEGGPPETSLLVLP